MLVTRTWIAKNYDKFNKELFGGMLPTVKFSINRSRKTWGCANFLYDYPNDTIIPNKLTISNYYDSPENVKIQTLLHEMIHIADFTFHPEHYIHNGRRVTGHQYDAHGYWFIQEAQRISRESGYKVTNEVTREEYNVSTLSDNSKKLLDRKRDIALICVLTDENNMNFYFKTDIYKVKDLPRNLKRVRFYGLGNIKSIKYYTFDDPRYANMRSCSTRFSGWLRDRMHTMNFLKGIKATEVRF